MMGLAASNAVGNHPTVKKQQAPVDVPRERQNCGGNLPYRSEK
jgi:hypothetical protein